MSLAYWIIIIFPVLPLFQFLPILNDSAIVLLEVRYCYGEAKRRRKRVIDTPISRHHGWAWDLGSVIGLV